MDLISLLVIRCCRC